MLTTIYINCILYDRLRDASSALNIQYNDLISILLSRIISENNFKARPYETVQYQASYPEYGWKTVHVKFEPVFYEKAQDLRRNYKFSVSWFISYAIINYLDEIVKKLLDSKNQNNFMDNYHRNFVYIAKMFGEIQVFITMLGLPEEKYLKKLLI